MFDDSLLAIDIGSSAIKLVEVSKKDPSTILNLGVEFVPFGAVVDGAIKDEAVVLNCLVRLLKKLKLKKFLRRTAISLGGSSVLLKRVMFAKSGLQTSLAETVFNEAEQHFQHDISELFFDFVKGHVTEHDEEIPVTLVGAKRDIVQQHISLIKKSGLKIGVIECQVFSLCNIFERIHGRKDGLVGIVNIGAHIAQMFLLGGGEYVYTRDISMGGSNYTKHISAKLGISIENAESLKIAASTQRDFNQPEVTQALLEINQQIVSEMQLTIDFFFQKGGVPGYKKVKNIYLVGGGAKTFGLKEAIADQIKIDVEILQPFTGFNLSPLIPKKYTENTHYFGVAAGLSLRTFQPV